MEKLEELLKQDWVVGESGKELLELLIEQNKTLKELVENLQEQIAELDKKVTLQTEISDINRRLTEIEQAPIVRRVAGICTPSRDAITGTSGYVDWTPITYGTTSSSFSASYTDWLSSQGVTGESAYNEDGSITVISDSGDTFTSPPNE